MRHIIKIYKKKRFIKRLSLSIYKEINFLKFYTFIHLIHTFEIEYSQNHYLETTMKNNLALTDTMHNGGEL